VPIGAPGEERDLPQYIEFATADGQGLLVEVDQAEAPPTTGVAKAGLLERRSGDVVASARKSFDDAVRTVVGHNVESFTGALRELRQSPDEVELAFALKATGEVGNFAIAKVGGEANFSIRLVWRDQP
jgi:hypothetical protein